MSGSGPRRSALSAAERKREQRIRQAERIATLDSGEWTDQDCLFVLSGASWRGGAVDRAAWRRLGQLRGFLDGPG